MDATKAAEFVNAVFPKDLESELAKLQTSENGAPTPSPPIVASAPLTAQLLDLEEKPRLLTEAEIRAMDPVELAQGMHEGRYRLE
jgi:hypothetical protein